MSFYTTAIEGLPGMLLDVETTPSEILKESVIRQLLKLTMSSTSVLSRRWRTDISR